VAARHALAGHWGQQGVPMLSSGKVSYEIGANIDVTCFGGIAAVHRLVTKLDPTTAGTSAAASPSRT
jgi:hypothetical protein